MLYLKTNDDHKLINTNIVLYVFWIKNCIEQSNNKPYSTTVN